MKTIDSTNTTQSVHRRNRPLLYGGFALLFAAIAVLVFWGSFTIQQVNSVAETVAPAPEIAAAAVSYPSEGPPLAKGDTPYEFNLPGIDGSSLQLSGFHGQPVILNYWASWCGPCRLEAPHLQAAHEQFADTGLVLIGINQDEPVPDAQGFVDEFGWSFPVVLDENADTAKNYGIFGTLPVTIFISPDGEVTQIHRGPIADSQIATYVAEILP